MTDKELLELAAKAAGIELHHWCGDTFIRVSEYVDDAGGYWNPLTDDADALRLAVRLELDVEFWGGFDEVRITLSGNQLADEDFNNDPYAATRRAIVKAAVEIGRGMG